jgi:hypothetical protein
VSRQQWAWIVALGVALAFLLATGQYAYAEGALGGRTAGFVRAMAWALGVVAALGNLVGVLGAVRESSQSALIRAVNARAGRWSILVASAVLGTLFLIAALRVEPAAVWSCRIARRLVGAPTGSRCPDGSFARMRSFPLELSRGSEATDEPTFRARVSDRSASSVAIDSDRGGLCAGAGPDQPTRGESRLALTPACGADRTYRVNVHLCDVHEIEAATDRAAELGAAVHFEIWEGNHAYAVACE